MSGILIDEETGIPSAGAYRSRFKSLLRAYELIGYTPQRDHRYLEVNRRLREYHRGQIEAIVKEIAAAGASVQIHSESGLLTVNGEFTTSLVLGRCREVSPGTFRWLLRLDTSLTPDITIAARLAPGNESILDYYLLPSIDALGEQLRLAPQNGFLLDVYRFEDLSFFFRLVRRHTIEEAA